MTASSRAEAPFGWVALLLLVPLLVAPTPGNVGGCGDEAVPADAVWFCNQKEYWVCRRDFERGAFGSECECSGKCTCAEGDTSAECVCESTMQADCLEAYPRGCASAAWPADCSPLPSEREANSCIDALKAVDRLGEATDSMPECQALCPSTGTAEPPDAGGDT